MPHVVNDGVAIHYRVEGSGSPLILQHGFTDSSETLYELGYVDALKAKHQVILPDTRGHGRSDKPHDPQAYRPANFATDIVAVLNDVGVQKAAYWGYSQGGWIAFALARHTADRVSGFVIGGAASAGSAFPAKPGEDDPLITLPRAGPEKFARAWGEWLTPTIKERIQANDTAALIACRQQRLATDGYADLGEIAVPTLVYAGSADPIHDGARQSASEIPGATFISLPDLNHIGAMCQPALILPQVQEFLEKASSSIIVA
jgi:pimeloyl-ACP methyl ester carboxylesterase